MESPGDKAISHAHSNQTVGMQFKGWDMIPPQNTGVALHFRGGLASNIHI